MMANLIKKMIKYLKARCFNKVKAGNFKEAGLLYSFYLFNVLSYLGQIFFHCCRIFLFDDIL